MDVVVHLPFSTPCFVEERIQNMALRHKDLCANAHRFLMPYSKNRGEKKRRPQLETAFNHGPYAYFFGFGAAYKSMMAAMPSLQTLQNLSLRSNIKHCISER